MASKYAGTQTEKNLEAAFAGESQARNKYTYFASKAKKEGFEQMAEIFLKTADNEKEHAKMWFKELGGLQRLQRKKALPHWQRNSAGLQLSKNVTKNVIVLYFTISKLKKYSQRAMLRYGNAVTAVIS